MVIIPASIAVAEGLTFIVGHITWSTHAGGLTTTTLEENQIRPQIAKVVAPITMTTTTTTPTTQPVLPRYKGKQVDNSDLHEAIDHANHRLLEVSDLVDSISHQTSSAPAPNFSDSHRPTHATTHERLGTSLMVTREGRTVKFKTTSPSGSLPHGLSNAADQVSRHTRSLFRKMGLSSQQPKRPARCWHFLASLLKIDHRSILSNGTRNVGCWHTVTIATSER